jgi:hypothetical protein
MPLRTSQDVVTHWVRKAGKALVGRKIVGVRYLSDEEVDGLGWTQSVLVIHLDDGSILFPSMDDEGNNGGALFGQTKDGESLDFPVIR